MTERNILITGGSGFIGTHFIDSLLKQEIPHLNLDIVNPREPQQEVAWINCNILNKVKLFDVFSQFLPTEVVHLAARTTTDGKKLEDYLDNTEGTANVLDAIRNTPSVSRVVITSSQHVRKPGSGLPKHNLDFNPHGFYGQSKVITEQLTHEANLRCVWTIIRPTTVWGPDHILFTSGLWNLMSKGWYVHPKNDPVIRSYGYVKNVVWGIERILNAPSDKVDKRVFYLGDDPIKQSEWIDSFSLALIDRKTTKVPKEWIYVLARIGDLLERIGFPFPMNSPRYFNLTTTNPVPVDSVIKQFGDPPYSLEDGIAETVAWLKRKVTNRADPLLTNQKNSS